VPRHRVDDRARAGAVDADRLAGERHAESRQHNVGPVDGTGDRARIVRIRFGDDQPRVGERIVRAVAGHGNDVVAGIEGLLHELTARESVGSKDSDLHLLVLRVVSAQRRVRAPTPVLSNPAARM
jgi:hypothetical protein